MTHDPIPLPDDRVIRAGVFHPHPVGALLWQCDVCHWPFVWSEHASAYCNGGNEPLAVVCSAACRAKLEQPTDSERTIGPVGLIGHDRVPRVRGRYPFPPECLR